MAILATATGHLIRLALYDDGTLVLAPLGRVAAVWLFNTPSTAPLHLRPEHVIAISDTLPSPDGVMLGWLAFATPGPGLRVPYRLSAQGDVRFLLREAAAVGYPERVEVGQAARPEPVPLLR